MDQKIWYLKRADLFSWMNDSAMRELAGALRHSHCEKDHIFYFSEEPSDQAYLVKEGKIRLGRVNSEGREITLDIVGPGEVFGEMAVTGEGQRSHFAQALEKSMVCSLPRTSFETFLHKHPELAFRVIRLIGFRRREIENRLEDLAFQPVAERLRSALSKFSKKYGKKDNQGRMSVPISQKDLAYLVGTSRETVAEELGRMKRQGLVQTSYRSILLCHPD